jgi:hypothetical protein
MKTMRYKILDTSDTLKQDLKENRIILPIKEMVEIVYPLCVEKTYVEFFMSGKVSLTKVEGHDFPYHNLNTEPEDLYDLSIDGSQKYRELIDKVIYKYRWVNKGERNRVPTYGWIDIEISITEIERAAWLLDIAYAL